MKDKNNLGKNFIKNGYFFLSSLHNKKDFLADLKKLFDKWPSKHRIKADFAWGLSSAKRKIMNDERHRQRIEFAKMLDKNNKFHDFYDDVDSFLKKHNLGKEWHNTIVDYIVSLWIYPPQQNMNIEECDNRVVLTLNPDTSLDDIKAVWPTISEKQKALWPNYKKINFSKKMFNNLFIVSNDIEQKIISGGVEIDTSENIEEYKIHDIDLVEKIWKDEVSKKDAVKRVAKLRQARRRLRHKQS